MNAYIAIYDDNLEGLLCTILRTCDGDQAYDDAIQFVQETEVIKGSYTGMPETQVNGPGHFAVALLNRLRNGWEIYTSLTTPIDFDSLEADDMLLEIHVPLEGQATWSGQYPLGEATSEEQP